VRGGWDCPAGAALRLAPGGRRGIAHAAAGAGGGAPAVWVSAAGLFAEAGGFFGQPQEDTAALPGRRVTGAPARRAQTGDWDARAAGRAHSIEPVLGSGFCIGRAGLRAAVPGFCVD
jgi:hypothetical protein